LKDFRLFLPDRGVADVLVELVRGLSASLGGEGAERNHHSSEVAIGSGETANVFEPSHTGLTDLEIISQRRTRSPYRLSTAC
jgi:hypothetical protein